LLIFHSTTTSRRRSQTINSDRSLIFMAAYSVSPAGPIEVFLLKVLFAAKFANFSVDIECTSVLQSLYPVVHLLSLIVKVAHLFLGLAKVIPKLSHLKLQCLHIVFKLHNGLTVLCEEIVSVLVIHLQDVTKLLEVKSQLVSLSSCLYKFIIKLERFLQIEDREVNYAFLHLIV
jgi:hypothetical protein